MFLYVLLADQLVLPFLLLFEKLTSFCFVVHVGFVEEAFGHSMHDRENL